MIFAVAFLLSAILSFALSLTVATLIGPGPFGLYSIALSLCVVLTTACFEWLRVATTRFYSDRSRATAPAIRATLGRAYAVTAVALAVAAGGVMLLGARSPGLLPAALLSPALLAAAVAAAIGTGLSDYRIALARCRFDDRLFAGLVIGRGAIGFALAAALAWLVGDPAVILSGWALGLLAVAALAGRPLRDPPGGDAGWTTLRAFGRYALPLVAAGAIYQLLPFLNRTLLGARTGYVDAGYFSLASEIPSRLFQNLGAVLDIALFQLAVRAHEQDGAEAGARIVARNVGIVAAVLLPAAAGLAAIWPGFEELFVPAAFQGRLGSLELALIPAFALFALAQYALNPVFQIRGRTAVVVSASVVALLADVLPLAVWPPPLRAEHVATVQLVALAAAVAVLAAAAVRAGFRLPWRDLAVAAGAACVMAAMLWPWREMWPAPARLPVQVAAGLLVYGTLAVGGDLCGARKIAAGLWRRATKR